MYTNFRSRLSVREKIVFIIFEYFYQSLELIEIFFIASNCIQKLTNKQVTCLFTSTKVLSYILYLFNFNLYKFILKLLCVKKGKYAGINNKLNYTALADQLNSLSMH